MWQKFPRAISQSAEDLIVRDGALVLMGKCLSLKGEGKKGESQDAPRTFETWGKKKRDYNWSLAKRRRLRFFPRKIWIFGGNGWRLFTSEFLDIFSTKFFIDF